MKSLKYTFSFIIILLFAAGCSQGIKDEMTRYTKPLRGSDYGSLKAKKAEQSQLDASERHTQLSKPNGSIQPLDDSGNGWGHNRALSSYKGTSGVHTIPSATYSSKLARHIDSVEGIGDARVFTSDGHAYVALVLDYTGQGILKSKESGEREIGTRQTAATSPTSQQSIHNNPFRFFLTVNDHSQLSDRFIRTVTDSIKEMDPSITEVHISANRDFMYYMDEFSQLAWGGQSIEPYAEQFSILINHQFFSGHEMPTSLKQIRDNQ